MTARGKKLILRISLIIDPLRSRPAVDLDAAPPRQPKQSLSGHQGRALGRPTSHSARHGRTLGGCRPESAGCFALKIWPKRIRPRFGEGPWPLAASASPTPLDRFRALTRIFGYLNHDRACRENRHIGRAWAARTPAGGDTPPRAGGLAARLIPSAPPPSPRPWPGCPLPGPNGAAPRDPGWRVADPGLWAHLEGRDAAAPPHQGPSLTCAREAIAGFALGTGGRTGASRKRGLEAAAFGLMAFPRAGEKLPDIVGRQPGLPLGQRQSSTMRTTPGASGRRAVACEWN